MIESWDKSVLVVRTKYQDCHWKSGNQFLCQVCNVVIPSVPQRNSSDISYPVKNNLSEKGRKITYIALTERYEHFFRLIIKAENLSKKDISNSLKDAKKSSEAGLIIKLSDNEFN